MKKKKMKIKIPSQLSSNITNNFLQEIKENSTNNNSKSIKDNNVFYSIVEHSSNEKKIYQLLGVDYDGKKYVSALPNPVHLFFSTAIELFEFSENIKQKYFEKYGIKDKNSNIYLLEFKKGHTNEYYTDVLKTRITSIIMLITALESFINQKIPNDFTYERPKKGELKPYDHKKIEDKIPFREKLEKILPQIINNLDFWKDKSKELEIILRLYDLRKNFIHLKTNSTEEWEMYLYAFDEMVSFDILQSIKAIINIVNAIEKDFFKLEIETPTKL